MVGGSTVPSAVLSENGKEFKNALYTTIKERYNVQQRYMSPAHPHSNGLSDRINNVVPKVTMAGPASECGSASADEAKEGAPADEVGTSTDATLAAVCNYDTNLADAIQLHNQKPSIATGVNP